MTGLRTLLVAALLFIMIGGFALVPRGSPTSNGGAASLTGPTGVALAARHDHGNKNDNNGNGNWNNNNDNHGNNNNGNGNGNSNNNNDNNGNGNSNNNNGNGNGNDNNGNDNAHWTPPPPPPPPPPPTVAGRCYSVGEVGPINLSVGSGTVTLEVVSASTFPQASRITLAKVDPSSVAATPGSRVDEIVFELRAQGGCDGSLLGSLPADANLGIAYGVSADKSSLRIAFWDGGQWVDVPAVPDPNPANTYVSATVRRTGTYVLYQSR